MQQENKWNTLLIHQMVNKFDTVKNEWSNSNICVFGCLYGDNGDLWAQTHEGFQLANYKIEIEDERGAKRNVVC